MKITNSKRFQHAVQNIYELLSVIAEETAHLSTSDKVKFFAVDGASRSIEPQNMIAQCYDDIKDLKDNIDKLHIHIGSLLGHMNGKDEEIRELGNLIRCFSEKQIAPSGT